MNHNTSAPKNIRFPTCVVTRYGSKYSKYKIYKEHLWSHTPFISTVHDISWHYHHLSKKDPPRNLRVTPGFGTAEDPRAPATAGTCEAAACLFRVEMGLEVPTCQVDRSYRSIASKFIARRPACDADPAGCPDEGWGAGCCAGVAGPGTSGASKTWFSPSISTSNCSPDWASSLRDSGILSNCILIFDVRPVWWISNSSSWRNIPSCRLGPHLRRGCKTSSSEQSNSNPLWQNSQPMCMITIWAFSPSGWRKPMHFSGMHFPVMTMSQKWPSATVAPPSLKVTVSSFSQPAGVDLQTVSAPAHAGTWTWLKSQQMSSISPKNHQGSCLDLLIMFQKSNRFSKGNEDIGLDHPRAFFTAVSWWQGLQLTSQLLQECLPAMLGCSFSTANYQKPKSEIQKRNCSYGVVRMLFWSPAQVLGRSQFSMSNFPSLHWRREGSIFRSEPEKSGQRHVAGRQHLR